MLYSKQNVLTIRASLHPAHSTGKLRLTMEENGKAPLYISRKSSGKVLRCKPSFSFMGKVLFSHAIYQGAYESINFDVINLNTENNKTRLQVGCAPIPCT